MRTSNALFDAGLPTAEIDGLYAAGTVHRIQPFETPQAEAANP